jgi:cytochrome c-type biogenesis protein
MTLPSFGLAFLAGLASFLSPCVFSLVPAYIGYLGGRAAGGEAAGNNRLITFLHGVAFVLGFSVVFITFGVIASALGGLLFDVRIWLARIGGLVVIVFGLHMLDIEILVRDLGVLRTRLPFLEYDVRVQTMPDRANGFLSSALLGVFFSAGWSPCVGPILGTILTFAANGGSISNGAALLTAYSAGLAVPFLFAALGIGWVTTILRKHGKVMRYVEIAMGAIMIIVGVMLMTGIFNLIAQRMQFFWVDFGL